MPEVPHVHVAIVGTGFSGIGAAVRLKQQGVDDLVLFERADAVGGAWRDNVYPGCACDVPSQLYSFSFAPNPHWTRTFPPQPEILAYLEGVADRFGITPHVRLGHDLLRAAYDPEAQRWDVSTSRGDWTADILVTAVGTLSDPLVPDLPGLGTFAGTTFHSARWNHDHVLDGRRVAVIGTGASSIQFVPEITGQVGHLTLFQRTAPWIIPRTDRRLPRRERVLYRAFPPAQRLVRTALFWVREKVFLPGMLEPEEDGFGQRLARELLETQVTDPELRARLTPTYPMGCKRILQSDTYLPAVAGPNVAVVTDPVREVRPDGIVTADGAEHAVDTIIFATGFQATDLPIAHRVLGEDGRTLAEHWDGSPRAHLGTTVAGFPNAFVLLGPNTGLAHSSVIYMVESQLEHVIGAVRHLRRTGAATIAPRPSAQAAYNADLDERMRGTVWSSGRCASWYLDATGRNAALWPDFSFRFRRRVARFDAREYIVTPRRGVPSVEPALV